MTMTSNKWDGLASVILSIVVICTGCQGGETLRTPLQRGISNRVQKWAVTSIESDQDQKPLLPLETESELQIALEQYGKNSKLPGVVLALATSQQTWMTATGQADLTTQIALQPKDRFRIGAISEMFIAVICLQLAEEGVLSLSDPIVNWLPAEVYQQIPRSDQITIQQLLSHTSGLPDLNKETFQQVIAANPTHRWTAQELLTIGFDQQKTIPRGTFSASTANYLLLELLLERVTGGSLADSLQERILKPLALKDTFVELSTEQPTAHGYQDWDQDGSPEDVTQPLLNTGLGLGSVALVSNAPDLIRFTRALFFESTLLTNTSRQKMLSLIETSHGGYGLGISHTMTRWGEIWGQIGNTTGFSSALLYLPVHDLIVVTWTNSASRKTYQSIELVDNSLNIVLGQGSRFAKRTAVQW